MKSHSVSTQNQAFCALLFLYRYVLEKPLVDKIDAVRAKRPKRLPIVLSQKEVASLLSIADPSSKLFILLLYGCGLRLHELLNLRIKDIDFENNQIMIRDRKGSKDRTVMLPGISISLLKEKMEYVRLYYNEDRITNAPGVFIPYA